MTGATFVVCGPVRLLVYLDRDFVSLRDFLKFPANSCFEMIIFAWLYIREVGSCFIHSHLEPHDAGDLGRLK